MKTTNLIIAVLLYTVSYGQTTFTPLTKLKHYNKAPDPDTFNTYYNKLPNNIAVIKKNRRIYAVPKYITNDTIPFSIKLSRKDSIQLWGTISVLEVSDGFLIAGNNGEFGGSLYWFSKTDTGKYTLKGRNINGFIKKDRKIYAIEGIGIGCTSDGKILEIKNSDGKWYDTTFLNLNSAPYIIKKYKRNAFVILASSGMYLIDKKKRIQTLIDGEMWEYILNPNSIVIKNKTIYAGVGYAIIKYNLSTHKEEWFMP